MRSYIIASCLFVLLVLGVSSQALDNVEWVNGAGGTSDNFGNDVSISPNGDIYSVGEFNGPTTFGPDTLEGGGMFVSKITSNGTWVWTVGVNNTFRVSAISTDLDGNAYVTGSFIGTLIFGSFQINSSSMFTTSVFVAKIYPNATWMWAVTMNGNCTSQSGDIVVNNTDIYIGVGFYENTCLFGSNLVSTNVLSPIIAKLDTDGIWLDAYLVTVSPGGGGSFRAISVSESFVYGVGGFNGNIIIASDVLSSKGASDILIAKLNPQNTWVWGRRAGGVGSDDGEGVTSDENGNVYPAGFFAGSADFGQFILNSTIRDIFVAKLDSDGVWFWAVTNLELNNLPTVNVANDIASNVSSLFVTGRIMGEYVFGPVMINTDTPASFVASLDFGGNWTDVVVFTSDRFSVGNALDVQGTCIANTGFFTGTTQFSNFTLNTTILSSIDAYILKIDLGFPAQVPTQAPTNIPTITPTDVPTNTPTIIMPTNAPTTITPTDVPTTITPTGAPTTITPTDVPTNTPTIIMPTNAPTTITPTGAPTTITPTGAPTITPADAPTITPTDAPTTITPTDAPTITPTDAPTQPPTNATIPSQAPTKPAKNIGLIIALVAMFIVLIIIVIVFLVLSGCCKRKCNGMYKMFIKCLCCTKCMCCSICNAGNGNHNKGSRKWKIELEK